MRLGERTPHQLDPAGSAGSRVFTRVLMAGTLGYAIVVTLITSRQIGDIALAVAALVLLVASMTVMVVGAKPERAPLKRPCFLLALALVLAAVILESVSTATTNTSTLDGWGPISVGFLLLAFGSYRPARELAIGGIIAGGVVGTVVYFEVPFLSTKAPALVVVVVTVTPLLALCCGGIVHSLSLVRAFESWKNGSPDDMHAVASRLEDGIARAVQHDRAAILSRDVLPFFGDVLERGSLTAEDRERAATIAESIRSVMVAEIDRSWLEGVVAAIVPTADVVDDENLALFVSAAGRTALRALIVAIADCEGFDGRSLRIELCSEAGLGIGVLSAHLSPENAPRVDYAPYFALFRATFRSFDLEVHRGDLSVRFSFDYR